MLLVVCANTVGSDKYEEFAEKAYGRKFALFVGYVVMATLLGFVISYIVLIKTLIPMIISILFYGVPIEENTKIPAIIGDGMWSGQVFWALVYFGFVLFPISIPRKMSALRFSSLLGFACSVYLGMVIMLLFFCNRNLVPSVSH